MLEPSLFTLYLHQNMPQHYSDIGDLADSLEYFSHQDAVDHQVSYNYANMQELSQMAQLSGLICAQGITETNLHCLEAKQDRMLQMQAPYYFEHKRKLRTNKLTLQDQLKESQLASHQLLSEDLLIRSQREAQTNIVPFIL